MYGVQEAIVEFNTDSEIQINTDSWSTYKGQWALVVAAVVLLLGLQLTIIFIVD